MQIAHNASLIGRAKTEMPGSLMEKTIYTKEYTTFLKCLRKARTEAGITQIEMAERIEQTQSFISRCERGERRIDIIELRVFCQAIGIPITDFIAQLEETIAAEG